MSVTLTSAKAAYLDNADWAESGSLDKARAFSTACRRLLLLVPKRSRLGDGEVEIDPVIIRSELKSAQDFVNANSGSTASNGGCSVVHASFEEDYR